ncbi:MAG: N-acetylglucosamine-6-phosphate deacetylase [Ginsengibacter sp.]
MLTAYSADKIFTGATWFSNGVVIVKNDRIADIIPLNDYSKDVPVLQHSAVMAPAFIDIQIYGASSKLFSVYPESDTLHKMNALCNSGGTKYFLPTIATNTTEVLKKGIDAIHEYWKNGGEGVPGLHIEGPWINKIKRGAHIEEFIHLPEFDEVKHLLEYGKGVIKMITLAPEVCPVDIIDLIKSYGVIVSAGHSNATYEESVNTFKKDIRFATHIFNAMSPLHHRAPGLPVAIMLHSSVMASIVADGYHVDFAMINMAKKLMGERLFLITDAVTETTEGPYPHILTGDKYMSNDILSGSALTMMQAVRNCVGQCDIPLEEAFRMASLYPAKVLGLDNETGKIEKGYKADLVMMNENLEDIICI